MTNRDTFRQFAQSMGFITPQSASYLKFGDCTPKHQTRCANELRKMIGNGFKRLDSSLKQRALYGYGDKRSPRPHDVTANLCAARYYFNTGIIPCLQYLPKYNNRHSDFISVGQHSIIYFEFDNGTEGYNGNRQLEDKLKHYDDGEKVVFIATSKFSNDLKAETARCEWILDQADKYRTDHKCQLSVYVIQLSEYLKGANRPWSRKKNGQIVMDISI